MKNIANALHPGAEYRVDYLGFPRFFWRVRVIDEAGRTIAAYLVEMVTFLFSEDSQPFHQGYLRYLKGVETEPWQHNYGIIFIEAGNQENYQVFKFQREFEFVYYLTD